MSTGNKSIGIVLGLVVGLGAVGAGAWFWQQSTDNAEEATSDSKSGNLAVAKKLPKDTMALTSAQGLASLFLEFDEEFESFLESDDVVSALNEVEDELGLNPAKPLDLKRTGFSFTDPWTAAAFGDFSQQEIYVAVFIPVDDEERVTELFENLIENLDAEIEQEEIDGVDGWVFGDEVGAIMDDSHMVMCVPIEPDGDMLDASIDCLEELIAVEEDDSLSQNEHFQAAMNLVEGNWNWLTYTNIEAFRELGEEALEDEWDDLPRDARKFIDDLLDRAPATVTTAELTREAATIQIVQLLDTELAHQFAQDGSDDLAERIPGDPLLVTRWSLKLHSIWKVFTDWKPIEDEVQDVLDEVEKEIGIDIEDDVIANFAGHFSMVVLESKGRRGPLPVDLVLYAPLEDQKVAIETVETLVDTAKDMNGSDEIMRELRENERDDGVLYTLSNSDMSLCFGMLMDHLLVVVSSAQDCEDLVEDIEDGDESFLGELPNDVAKDFTEGPSTYMYLDTQRMVDLGTALERPDPLEAQGLDVLNQLVEGLEMSSWSTKEYTAMKMVVRANDEDFGPGIEAFIEMVMEEMY